MASWKYNTSSRNLPKLRDANSTKLDTKCLKCGCEENLNSYSHFQSGWDTETIFGKIYFKVCTNSLCGEYKYLYASSNLQEYWDKKDAMTDLDEAIAFLKVHKEKYFEWADLHSKSKTFLLSDSVNIIKNLVDYTKDLEFTLKQNNIPLPRNQECEMIGKKLNHETPLE